MRLAILLASTAVYRQIVAVAARESMVATYPMLVLVHALLFCYHPQ
jgi:hypothetical protein